MQTLIISDTDGSIINFDNVTKIYRQGSYVHAELVNGRTVPLFFDKDYGKVCKYHEAMIEQLSKSNLKISISISGTCLQCPKKYAGTTRKCPS